MRTDNEHKIVWVSSGREEHLKVPKRDFKALQTRVTVRKRKIMGIRIGVALVITLILLGIWSIFSDAGPKKPSEQPSKVTAWGPVWSAPRVDTMGLREMVRVIPQLPTPKKTPPKPVSSTVQITKDIPTTRDSIQVAKTKPPTLSADPKPLPKDSTQLSQAKVNSSDQPATNAQPYVPSKFERAYPLVGYDSLYQYLATYINHEALGGGQVEDTIRISFYIQEDGMPSGIRFSVELPDSVLNNVKQIIVDMPMWEPAKADGKPVRTRYRLPLRIDAAEEEE